MYEKIFSFWKKKPIGLWEYYDIWKNFVIV